MTKKHIKPSDNSSNQKNSNPETPGTNRQYNKVQDNRSKQMNPNQNIKKK